jgi:predicted metal-binding membrane protein
MTGMAMPHETWSGPAAGYLGMWMAMMVPMMLPSLIPMLSRYRRSVRGADGIRLHALTTLVGVGYFAVWAAVGAATYAAGVGVGAPPVAAGVVLVAAGGVQFTSWKARRLAVCRESSGCGCPPAPDVLSAWRHGLRLGVRCSLCCGSLMLALLAIGVMDLAGMAAVTLAISAERLAPVPLRAERVAGAVIVVAGVLTIVRV